jgi:hypothetical protein
MGISPHKILSLLVLFYLNKNIKKSYSILKVAKVFLNTLYKSKTGKRHMELMFGSVRSLDQGGYFLTQQLVDSPSGYETCQFNRQEMQTE